MFERRRAGVLVPLSALRSRTDSGIGDLADLRLFVDWVAARGLSLIQLLPVSPISPTAPFPYSAYSAFGLDLTVIALAHVPEVRDSPPAQARLKTLEDDGTLPRLRQAERLDYAALYTLKHDILALALPELLRRPATDERRRQFEAFNAREKTWLEPFALFTALKHRYGWRTPWTAWPEEIRNPSPAMWRTLLEREAEAVRLAQYIQWIAHDQWDAVHTFARGKGVFFMGDMPIYVGGDSADVWARRREFDLDADGGAPPDYFNWLGQNWAAPLYDAHDAVAPLEPKPEAGDGVVTVAVHETHRDELAALVTQVCAAHPDDGSVPWSETGVLTSRPFTFTGRKLVLNVDTGAGGYIQVGLLRGDGMPIEGYGAEKCVYVNGNELRYDVEWLGKGTDLSAISGQPVRLVIRLHGARLYSLQFTE